MRTLLIATKRKCDEIFNFYMSLQRSDLQRLIWPTVLITLFSFTLYFLCSYLVNLLYFPADGFQEYIDRNYGVLYLLGSNINYVNGLILLNIGLCAPYYLLMNDRAISFIQAIRHIKEKKLILYFFFLFIFGVLIQLPRLLFETDEKEFMGVFELFEPYNNGFSMNFWVTDLFNLLIYTITILFAYLIANTYTLNYNDIYKHRGSIVLGLIFVFVLDVIFFSLNNGIKVYITPPLTEYLDMPVLSTFINMLSKVLFCITVPVYVIALSKKETIMHVKKEIKTEHRQDDVIDNFD